MKIVQVDPLSLWLTGWRQEDQSEPSGLCGSRRRHGPHWRYGQTTGKRLHCPGHGAHSLPTGKDEGGNR